VSAREAATRAHHAHSHTAWAHAYPPTRTHAQVAERDASVSARESVLSKVGASSEDARVALERREVDMEAREAHASEVLAQAQVGP
jgi:hypothetical protein